jgi:regulator of protease activity HflC (stomatin/prohibitin superfamily)
MNWIQSLIDFFVSTWQFFFPLTLLKPYEGGVILRWGLYQRDAAPGRNWTIPLGIEEIMTCNTTPNGVDGPYQSAVTKDGIPIVFRAFAIFRVHDVKRFLLEIENAESVLEDALGGTLLHLIHTHTWEEINDPEFYEKATKAARKRSWKWGVEVLSIQFKTLSPVGLKWGVIRVPTD